MTDRGPAAGLPSGRSARHPGRWPAGAGGAAFLVLPDLGAVVSQTARLLVAAITSAVEARGRAHVALTGGSTAAPLYRELAGPLRDQVPWARTHCWWGDERFVPREHPLSNMFPADRLLLGAGGVPVPAGNIHPIPATTALNRGLDATWAAEQYAAELRASLPLERGQPIFDVVLVGVGPDGHLLSVFPDSPAFEAAAPVVAVPAPAHVVPHVPRITLNPAVLDVARSVIVVVTGAAKSRAVGEILAGSQGVKDAGGAGAGGADDRSLPARRALRQGATWLLDEAAAAEIDAGG